MKSPAILEAVYIYIYIYTTDLFEDLKSFLTCKIFFAGLVFGVQNLIRDG